MARIPINFEAAVAVTKAAADYGKNRDMDSVEMGVAMILAGFGLLSIRLTSVQLDEVIAHIRGMTAELRKPQAS